MCVSFFCSSVSTLVAFQSINNVLITDYSGRGHRLKTVEGDNSRDDSLPVRYLNCRL